MTYATRAPQTGRDDEYLALEKRKGELAAVVQAWMDRATALHTDSPAQAEKDDVVALRDAFVLQLRTVLGV
jgi:hypothetical protein